jgi:3-hydroxyisobutyrate dehydrogenase-like beta-hydroxyacid dehydrogenase
VSVEGETSGTSESGGAAGIKVGFVGTGTMGNPMATNLLMAGAKLTVHDLRRESTANLVEAGAVWADSPGDVAAASEVTFLSLPNPADVDKVVRRPDGVLAGAASGATIIDLSTNAPELVRALSAAAADKGVTFLDAPVSGGVSGARRATLAVMVGGDEAAFEQYKSVLGVVGDRVIYVGPSGTGSVAKLVNNMLFFQGLMGTLEALVLAGKAGVDLNLLRDVVLASSGASFAFDYASRAILQDRMAPNFAVSLAAKDAALNIELAEHLQVPVPVGAVVRDELVRHRDAGLGPDDVLAIVRALEQEADVRVRGTGTSVHAPS